MVTARVDQGSTGRSVSTQELPLALPGRVSCFCCPQFIGEEREGLHGADRGSLRSHSTEQTSQLPALGLPHLILLVSGASSLEPQTSKSGLHPPDASRPHLGVTAQHVSRHCHVFPRDTMVWAAILCFVCWRHDLWAETPEN